MIPSLPPSTSFLAYSFLSVGDASHWIGCWTAHCRHVFVTQGVGLGLGRRRWERKEKGKGKGKVGGGFDSD
jgi:hypothetical protein